MLRGRRELRDGDAVGDDDGSTVNRKRLLNSRIGIRLLLLACCPSSDGGITQHGSSLARPTMKILATR